MHGFSRYNTGVGKVRTVLSDCEFRDMKERATNWVNNIAIGI